MATIDDSMADGVLLSMVPGVGPRLLHALLAHFGDAGAALDAAPSELRSVPGIGPKLVQAIIGARSKFDVSAHLAQCQAAGIDVVTLGTSRYPDNLRHIPDPPGVLYVKGAITERDAPSVAIVGSRHGTQYGRAVAEKLAGSLARAGLTIISGLARGIDGAAHRAALAAGGRTIAVLATGVEKIYPPEHAQLAREVTACGALVSEAAIEAPPVRGAFPQRNRLISGLSLGVIVIEASLSSGALITARHAAEQGREVFAVPGRIDNRMAQGCHRLLREGARLVESADDVLEELGHLAQPAPAADGTIMHHPAEVLLNEVEQQVLAAIDQQSTSIDQVVSQTGLPTPQVLAAISVLEMRRLVRRLSGSTLCRP